MATRVAVLALVVLSSVASASAVLSGGATSINTYISKGIIPAFNAARARRHKSEYPAYDSVGSSNGINGFNNGTYAYAFSDNPMSASQDAAAPAKLTIPAALGTYSFVTKKKQGIKLTGRQLARIYLGKIRNWRHFKGVGTGRIIPVCRSDGSGTTQLVTKYLQHFYPAWPPTYVGSATLLGGPFSPFLVAQTGSGGVGAYVASHPDAIGYVQSGVGVITYKAYEIAIGNDAHNFVRANQANPTSSIPRTLPPYGASWADVTLLNQPGKETFPIASFVYSFIRKDYRNTPFASSGRLVKTFAKYVQSNAVSGLASQYFFFEIPSNIRQKSYRAIQRQVTP